MTIQQEDKRTIRKQIEEDEQRVNQQRESGKKIISENINNLSMEFMRPDISDFSFEINHKDFDCDRVSILDMNRRVVMKVTEEELTDISSSSTPEVRLRFEARLRAAVVAHYKLSIPE